MSKKALSLPDTLTCPCGAKAPLEAAQKGFGKLYRWCWLCPDCQGQFEIDLKKELEELPF